MLRILLVNDTPRHFGRLREGLEKAGYCVVGESSDAFLLPRQVAALQPDVIIVDTESPSRDALEQVCVVSQSDPRPIVMFTADSQGDSIRAAIQSGVSAYIVEGLSEARLAPILQVAQARFEADQQLKTQLATAENRLAERKTIDRAKGLLIANPRDIPALVKEIAKYRVTVITAVNTLFNALVNNADFAHVDFSHLKLSVGGGMAVQKAVADKWQKITNQPIIEAYGLTETSPGVCVNPLSSTSYSGNIGLPISNTDIDVRDGEGKSVGIGEAGELFVRGPQVMRGYWNMPEETQKVLGADGFLSTGDVVIVNEQGFVKIVDRKKDMIVVSGFNVYPNEIEDVVASHPGVLEVACVGVPSEKSGEAIRLFVVKKDPNLTREDLIAFCRENLTGYKIPKDIVFKNELPKSNVGKILRRELKDAPADASK